MLIIKRDAMKKQATAVQGLTKEEHQQINQKVEESFRDALEGIDEELEKAAAELAAADLLCDEAQKKVDEAKREIEKTC